jgi:hypothetical protein
VAQDLGALAVKAQRMQTELADPAMQARLKRVAERLTKVADAAVPADIGDQSMSGWKDRDGNAIEMLTAAKELPDGGAEVAPKRALRGPWRVLTDGRRATMVNDKGQMYRLGGTRVRKKDGLRVDKIRKVKRRSGATRGKGTWRDAMNDMERAAPKLLADEANRALVRAFKR